MQKVNRLRKNQEFQKLIDSKKQIVSNFLIFYFRANNENLKVGISISKKFANAVFRNKYRRQTKAALDQIKPWELKFDVVIILRKTFLDLDYEQKTKELNKMFERLKNESRK